jgi:hypothetical protein
MRNPYITSITKTVRRQEWQQLALTDFELFCRYAQVDKLQLYICTERRKGKSYGTLALQTGISRQAVAQRCKRCGG